MARILLIEDDQSLGGLLEVELRRAGHDCTWAMDAFSGLSRFRAVDPELVLLDLNLPDHSGFDVLEQIRVDSLVPVIILTARNRNDDKVRGFDLGADDYVTKPFWHEELLARIRARLRRPAPQEGGSDRIRRHGVLSVDLEGRTVSVAGKVPHLTPTEFDLLAYLLHREGRAVRRQQLIDDVLVGEESTETALQTHISRLRRKLGEAGPRISTVWGIGYRFDGDSSDA